MKELNRWDDPVRRSWWPYCPLVVLASVMLVVTGSMYWFGQRFVWVNDLPNDLKNTKYIPASANLSEAKKLRDRAAIFEQRIDELEQQAIKSLGQKNAKDLKNETDLYRKWSQELEKQAAQLEIQAAAGATALSLQQTSRILWVYSAAVDIVLLFVALVAGYGIILAAFWNSAWRPKRRFLSIALIISIIVPLAWFIVFQRMWHENSGVASRLLYTYLGPDAPGVFRVVAIDNGLHFAGAWLYIVLASVILSFPRVIPSPKPEEADGTPLDEETWQFANAMRLIRLMLYILATLLVIYVLNTSALFHWSLAYVNPEQKELFASVEALTTSAVTMRSLQATMLIAAIYLPSYLLLRMLAWELVSRAMPNKSLPEQEEWLKQQGLIHSTTLDQLKPVAAIIAPLVAGQLAELLKVF